ncbi:MAG: RdgB/HAM1 family non-canonical purine NTP pyrophosphatase [Rhodospirillaceae bacterium]
MNARRFTDDCLVVASHNQGKVREIKTLLEPFSAVVVSAGELNLPEPEETGTSFVANAELKALASAKASGKVALADDSGLAVSALGGAPGIFSARWAGRDNDFALAMHKVETELGTATDRSARFICALTLAWPDGHRETFEGSVLGALSFPPRGDKGFGYDAIFIPDGFDITFAEMAPSKKHAMSHRAEAFHKLVAACFA